MKIKLKYDWEDFGHLHTKGTIVDVSDRDGERLISEGHELMHPDTRSTRNLMYYVGCIPPAAFQSTATPPPVEGAKQTTNTKQK